MSQPVQLKTALAQKGYKIKDLWGAVCLEYPMEYKEVALYARMLTRRKNTDLQKERWKFIDRALERMGVDW